MCQNAANGIRVQGGIEDAPARADAPEQRPGTALGHLLPVFEGALGASFDMFAAWQADLRPLPRFICLATQNANTQSVGSQSHILDLQRHHFGAAQRPGKADQQQGAIAAAALAAVAGGDDAAEHVQRERRGLFHRPSVFAQHALQGLLDIAMRRVPGQVVEPVHFADGRQPPANGGGCVAGGQTGEICADGGGSSRHRVEARPSAPGGIMRPVCLVGAQCRRRRGLARIGLCVGQCGRGLGAWRNLDGPVGGGPSIQVGLLRLVGIGRSGGIFAHGDAESAAFRGHASQLIHLRTIMVLITHRSSVL